PRFERRTAGAAQALAGQPRFRAGYDFLRLRADAGELPAELADWGEDYHLGSEEDREAMLADLRASQQPRVRRVPGPRAAAAPSAAPVDVDLGAMEPGAAATAGSGPGGADGESAAEDPAGAPRRRRRRRRRGGARGDGPGPGTADGS
ncbi:MAG: polynucleotide adenylyltransferase PcnB, partial [Pseudomonadota bacterium]